MGIYINPPQGEKESFLAEYGTPLDDPTEIDIDHDRSKVVVCWIDHYGHHTAAAICYSNAERDRFINGRNGRKMRWYTVPVERIGKDAGLPAEYPSKWTSDKDYWEI